MEKILMKLIKMKSKKIKIKLNQAENYYRLILSNINIQFCF